MVVMYSSAKLAKATLLLEPAPSRKNHHAITNNEKATMSSRCSLETHPKSRRDIAVLNARDLSQTTPISRVQSLEFNLSSSISRASIRSSQFRPGFPELEANHEQSHEPQGLHQPFRRSHPRTKLCQSTPIARTMVARPKLQRLPRVPVRELVPSRLSTSRVHDRAPTSRFFRITSRFHLSRIIRWFTLEPRSRNHDTKLCANRAARILCQQPVEI
jgi:hypothetical protein